ncbi:MAG: SEL1-like repeat protein [Rhizobiales bacterium]|nr:SEL1-like repeat protein [Hyphomicrobiales bacterium]
MNSRGSWNVEEIEPSVRERAEAAAGRAGMSLTDWLNSSIGGVDETPKHSQPATAPLSSQNTPEVAEIHHRLDSIARQIETISRPTDRDQPPVARQLNDAISRLDERLSRITTPRPQAEPQQPPQPAFTQSRPAPVAERPAAARTTAASIGRASSLDFAIAEILARQSELETDRAGSLPPFPAAAVAPAPGPATSGQMSALERQLAKISSHIEALHQPAQVDHAIASFRGELADIRRVITEAMPRQAIESIERDIRLLAHRIDDSRHNGSDDQTLVGVERALGDIQHTLRTLTPAEQLAGFDDAIRGLGARLDTIVRTGEGPGTMQQLEEAIAALRGIVSNVASNEALAQLSEHVQALSSKVDQLARSEIHSDSFAALEARIATLTSALESRPQRIVDDRSEQIESALRALSERLDRMPVAQDGPSAFAHLEQRVSYLLERLEASADHRMGGLSRVEEGLQDILRHLERQQVSFAALSNPSAGPAMDDAVVGTIRRELSDIRHSQSESNRTTQDTLEAVHNTLAHVVDRLTVIEGDLRTAQPAPSFVAAPSAAPLPKRPDLPNPAQGQKPPFAPSMLSAPAEAPVTPEPNAIRDILTPRPRAESAPIAPPPIEMRSELPRTTLGLDLPPDHPLEPGTRPSNRSMTPAERITASENALSEIGAAQAPDEPASTSSFIAAARRAAKAASTATPAATEKAARGAKLNDSIRAAANKGGKISSKIRALLVGASVVVIVLGTFKLAMTFLDGQSTPMAQNAVSKKMPAPAPAAPSATTDAPSMTSPTPIDRQSQQMPAGNPLKSNDRADAAPQIHDIAAPTVNAIADTPAPAQAPVAAQTTDETGSLTAAQGTRAAAPAASGQLTMVKIPASEKLPDAIGGPVLRNAALKGDPAAAHEVALRYAEGKGVAASLPEAAKWYERAAQGGVVPAMFRLGTLYEKGTGVTKNFDMARRYYAMAAERGNAKAMHNLAVLEADGGGNGANYRSASAWFHKAAARGVADSQFNLGILYARGIGVEQNLTESFKWFSLAAAQGDADAARKRDDVAKRLDPQSLAAAKLAVTSFTPEKQPDDAVSVTAPPKGWDAPLEKTASAKTASRTARAVH